MKITDYFRGEFARYYPGDSITVYPPTDKGWISVEVERANNPEELIFTYKPQNDEPWMVFVAGGGLTVTIPEFPGESVMDYLMGHWPHLEMSRETKETLEAQQLESRIGAECKLLIDSAARMLELFVKADNCAPDIFHQRTIEMVVSALVNLIEGQ